MCCEEAQQRWSGRWFLIQQKVKPPGELIFFFFLLKVHIAAEFFRKVVSLQGQELTLV